MIKYEEHQKKNVALHIETQSKVDNLAAQQSTILLEQQATRDAMAEMMANQTEMMAEMMDMRREASRRDRQEAEEQAKQEAEESDSSEEQEVSPVKFTPELQAAMTKELESDDEFQRVDDESSDDEVKATPKSWFTRSRRKPK
jgi:hypothetical protein